MNNDDSIESISRKSKMKLPSIPIATSSTTDPPKKKRRRKKRVDESAVVDIDGKKKRRRRKNRVEESGVPEVSVEEVLHRRKSSVSFHPEQEFIHLEAEDSSSNALTRPKTPDISMLVRRSVDVVHKTMEELPALAMQYDDTPPPTTDQSVQDPDQTSSHSSQGEDRTFIPEPEPIQPQYERPPVDYVYKKPKDPKPTISLKISELMKKMMNFVTTGVIQEKKLTPSSTRHSLFKESERMENMKHPILKIDIMRAEILKLDTGIIHPVVKVSVLDLTTGLLIKRSELSRNSRGEFVKMSKEKIDYVLPVMTGAYDMRKMQSSCPRWNEAILMDDSYKDFLDERILFIFEIIDFSANIKSRVKGFINIAWAFFKPISTCGRSNTEREVRLQLYKYPVSTLTRIKQTLGSLLPISQSAVQDVQENGSSLYELYINRATSTKYPSTLFVKLSAVERPPTVRVKGRALQPNEIERGKQTFADLLAQTSLGIFEQNEENNEEEVKDKEEERKQRQQELKRKKLKREQNEKCIIPDKMVYQLEAGAKGAMCVEFSHSGRYLAAGCTHSSTSSSIKIYDMWEGTLVANLSGHMSLVYTVDWRHDDKEIISASSDSTVKVWRPKFRNSQNKDFKESVLLQHPSFVYVAKYHPISQQITIIATGSFDKKIRIWNRDTASVLLELEGHNERVNSLCFTPDGTKLISGDARGVIKMWTCRLSKKATETEIKDSFTLLRTIEIPELTKSSLSSVLVDPNYPQERIFVHSQDNMIRRIEAIRKSVKNCYSGVKNSKNAQKCCVSPCGTYVVSGSDNGKVYFWDVESSKVVEGKDYEFSGSVFNLSWSKNEHLLAMCAFGTNEPIRVVSYEKKIEETKTTDESEQAATTGEESLRTLKIKLDQINGSRPGSRWGPMSLQGGRHAQFFVDPLLRSQHGYDNRFIMRSLNGRPATSAGYSPHTPPGALSAARFAATQIAVNGKKLIMDDEK